METSPRWTEVNIGPVSQDQPEDLLADVVDPLVHGAPGSHAGAWFWFWEPATEMGSTGDDEARLRLLWDGCADAGPGPVRQFLDEARDAAQLAYWYEGSHGRKGEQYEGEATFYGAEVWEATYRDWMAGSELALAIVKAKRAGTLTNPPSFHWRRRAHLCADQLRMDDVTLCLDQAQRYMRGKQPWRTRWLRARIRRYLAVPLDGKVAR